MSQVILTATNALSTLDLERLRLSAPSRKAPMYMLNNIDLASAIENGLNITDEILIRDILDNYEINFYTDAETDSLFIEYKFQNLDSLQSTVQRFNDVDKLGLPSGLIESDITNLSLMTVYPLETLTSLKQWHVDLYIEAVKQTFYL